MSVGMVSKSSGETIRNQVSWKIPLSKMKAHRLSKGCDSIPSSYTNHHWWKWGTPTRQVKYTERRG